MGNENGVWIMHGMSADDPGCIHTVDELSAFINRVGFLPLFKNDILGFSVEEHTQNTYWWTGDVNRDPWEWREVIARRGEIAYGKFFDNKAGFISKEWFPYFANHRRDGYDFDALWDDGKATFRQKRIMDCLDERTVIMSNALKEQAGYGKGGEPNFDGILTGLQMNTYLCMCDFRQRVNKKGLPYGWTIAVLAQPEHLWGYDFVTSAYREAPQVSFERICVHMKKLYPSITDRQFSTL